MNKKQRLPNNAKLLIANDLIYTLTALFIETFLVAYFLKITNDSIIEVSFFYIIMYLILGCGNLLIGKVVKIKTNYRNKIMSIGIVLRAVFILFIVILKEKIAVYFPIVATVYGISEVFYWVAHEVLFIDVTSNENRKEYMSVKKILGKITNIIAPLILGSSIELYSFTKIAVYVFILSVIEIIISLQIKNRNIDKKTIKKYNIKHFLKNINSQHKNKVNTYLKSAVSYGVIESSMKTLVVIITIMTFKTSLNLGILTSIFSVISMIALYLYKKYYNKNNSKAILYSCSNLIFFSIMALIIDINKITLIIFNLFYTVGIGILGTIYDTKKGDLVKECNFEGYKEEWVSYVGIYIAIGRIFGYTVMLIAGIFNNLTTFKILLAIVNLFTPVYSWLMYNVEKQKEIY